MCQALQWTGDSIDRILAGLDPVEEDGAAPMVTQAMTLGEIARVVDRLTAAVVDLTARVAELERPQPE